MKKLFMYALAIAGFTTINKVSAQQGFSVSVKAAPQFSFLYNKDDKNTSSYSRKATFNTNFGIGGAYNFDKNVGVGVDVLYSLQGQKYDLAGIEYNQKVNYVKVPVYFTYNSDASKPVSFIGKVGPQVSFLSDAKLSDKSNNKTIDATKDRYKTTTFGAAALAGAQFRLQPKMYLTTAVRYDSDFTNSENKEYARYVQGRAKTYNMTAGVEVGLKYMLN